MFTEYEEVKRLSIFLDDLRLRNVVIFLVWQPFLGFEQYAMIRILSKSRQNTDKVLTIRFLSKTTIVTFPIAGTYIEALSLTAGPKFYARSQYVSGLNNLPSGHTLSLEKLIQIAPCRSKCSGNL